MKLTIQILISTALTAVLSLSCEKEKSEVNDLIINTDGETIASYQVAKENMLRSIPHEYLDAARNNLHIA